jgi:hypothetical protein
MQELPDPYGELLYTEDLIARFGMSAQQLNSWRRNGQIICFGLSRRKRRYPVEQFTPDGCVLPGIRRLRDIISSQGETMLFLRSEYSSLNGKRPLDLLKQGLTDEVVAAAIRQYDVENWQ